MSRHLFVTQDFGPDLGGMARRHVELCRRFPSVTVSTVSAPQSAAFDAGEGYPVERQTFPFAEAKRFVRQVRWSGDLVRHLRNGVELIHLGNIRPCGYALAMAVRRVPAPWLVYVNGGDVLRERARIGGSLLKRWSARDIMGNASGIVANSRWTADITREVLTVAGVSRPPEVAAIDLGTDPHWFRPDRDTRALRTTFGIGTAPLLVTVARLVRHKGQDTVIRALAALGNDTVHYLMVGEGDDRPRLEALAASLGVADRVHFAGALSDDEVAEAYATATIYIGLSRLDAGVNVEGFGISFVEASASGVPVIGGDSGGVRSAIRDGETGVVVPADDHGAAAAAIQNLLTDDARRTAMGRAGRHAALSHYNWDRVARETLEFAQRVTGVGA